MGLELDKKEDLCIARGTGKFDVATSSGFKKDVKVAISEGFNQVIVNFSDVTFVDSSGLGALVACLRVANQSGGDLRLCCVTQEIRMLLELTRLHKVFEIFESEQDAISN